MADPPLLDVIPLTSKEMNKLDRYFNQKLGKERINYLDFKAKKKIITNLCLRFCCCGQEEKLGGIYDM